QRAVSTRDRPESSLDARPRNRGDGSTRRSRRSSRDRKSPFVVQITRPDRFVRFAMTHPVPRSEASLFDLLATRARSESDGRLVVDVVCGMVIVIATAVMRFALWPIAIGV